MCNLSGFFKIVHLSHFQNTSTDLLAMLYGDKKFQQTKYTVSNNLVKSRLNSEILVMAVTKNFFVKSRFDRSKQLSSLNKGLSASTMIPMSFYQHNYHFCRIKNEIEKNLRVSIPKNHFFRIYQDLTIQSQFWAICTDFSAIMYINKNFNLVQYYNNGINNFFCRIEKKINFINTGDGTDYPRGRGVYSRIQWVI